MSEVDKKKIQEFYENISSVWPEDNNWHLYSQKQIAKYVCHQKFNPQYTILNAGSGGSDYGLSNRMHHVDIAKNKIDHFAQYTVSGVEKMPFQSASFADVICVGDVINYCDARAAIAEFARVMKPFGQLILEFESSWGYEHQKSNAYKKPAAVTALSYGGEMQNQWLYSPDYIKKILHDFGFQVTDVFCFHILSSLHLYYNKHRDDNLAAPYAKFDGICRRIPLVNQHASNIIFKASLR
ncbi:hypothetical protein FACS1894111_06510 [Clostridia bacterium]|nr:hypothetical protein FACS1894111_06510 [Clostridia bacterium]